jgi:hypothetical protein
MTIQLLLNSYSNLVAGKNIDDVLSSNFSNRQRFDSMPGIKLKKGESMRSRTATPFRNLSQE